jgi:hypothetical protein
MRFVTTLRSGIFGTLGLGAYLGLAVAVSVAGTWAFVGVGLAIVALLFGERLWVGTRRLTQLANGTSWRAIVARVSVVAKVSFGITAATTASLAAGAYLNPAAPLPIAGLVLVTATVVAVTRVRIPVVLHRILAVFVFGVLVVVTMSSLAINGASAPMSAGSDAWSATPADLVSAGVNNVWGVPAVAAIVAASSYRLKGRGGKWTLIPVLIFTGLLMVALRQLTTYRLALSQTPLLTVMDSADGTYARDVVVVGAVVTLWLAAYSVINGIGSQFCQLLGIHKAPGRIIVGLAALLLAIPRPDAAQTLWAAAVAIVLFIAAGLVATADFPFATVAATCAVIWLALIGAGASYGTEIVVIATAIVVSVGLGLVRRSAIR